MGKDIDFVVECLNSDLYSYQDYMDDMIEKEGSVYNFLKKHKQSLSDWLDWFNGF
jgi:hypothetical protein